MSIVLKSLIATIGLLFFLLIVGSCSVIGIKNEAVSLETGLQAQYDQDRNNYANYFNKIKEMAQVPEMYVADLQKVYDGTMKGRYGAEGSKAMFQFIQEHNPNVDASLYKSIQQAMEAGRNSFAEDQKSLLDKKRVYQKFLGSSPGGDIAGFLGYPKIDLKKIDIVTNEETEQAFTTKKAGPIKLR